MMNKFTLYLNSIIIGMGFGMPTTVICLTVLCGYNEIMKNLIVWTIASALFGIVSRLFFDNERLNLPLATVLHLLTCFTISVVSGAICGYGDGILSLITGIAPVFIIVYLVIYLISIFIMKIEAKKATKALQEK